MNSKNPTVTNGPWCYGSISGSGIKGVEIQPFRIRELAEFESRGIILKDRFFKVQKGQLYGKAVAHDSPEYEKLGLLYGYTKQYGRNTIRFVQSRAARKRGYVSQDPTYNRKKTTGRK